MQPTSTTYLNDYQIVLPTFSNHQFDIAICDIPYGIDVGNMAYFQELQQAKNNIKQKNGTRLNGYNNKKVYTKQDWDKEPPPQQYFDELKRVSRHQIIFGVEYVNWQGLGNDRIKWVKFDEDKKISFKSYDLAYCSFIDYELELPLLWAGMNQAKSLLEPMTQQGDKSLNEKRIHPTHKPVLLYKALLQKFAAPGMNILDTHLGGGSSRIACYDYGCNFTGIEINPEYHYPQEQRFKEHSMQGNLFYQL